MKRNSKTESSGAPLHELVETYFMRSPLPELTDCLDPVDLDAYVVPHKHSIAAGAVLEICRHMDEANVRVLATMQRQAAWSRAAKEDPGLLELGFYKEVINTCIEFPQETKARVLIEYAYSHHWAAKYLEFLGLCHGQTLQGFDIEVFNVYWRAIGLPPLYAKWFTLLTESLGRADDSPFTLNKAKTGGLMYVPKPEYHDLIAAQVTDPNYEGDVDPKHLILIKDHVQEVNIKLPEIDREDDPSEVVLAYCPIINCDKEVLHEVSRSIHQV